MGRRGRFRFAQKRARMKNQNKGMMNIRRPNQRPMAQQPSGPTTGTTAGGGTASGPMNTSNRR